MLRLDPATRGKWFGFFILYKLVFGTEALKIRNKWPRPFFVPFSVIWSNLMGSYQYPPQQGVGKVTGWFSKSWVWLFIFKKDRFKNHWWTAIEYQWVSQSYGFAIKLFICVHRFLRLKFPLQSPTLQKLRRYVERFFFKSLFCYFFMSPVSSLLGVGRRFCGPNFSVFPRISFFFFNPQSTAYFFPFTALANFWRMQPHHFPRWKDGLLHFFLLRSVWLLKIKLMQCLFILYFVVPPPSAYLAKKIANCLIVGISAL